MTVNIDILPLYDPITKNNDILSDIWIGSLSTLIDTLSSYLTQYGLLVPTLTTLQRNSIQSPQEGQLIYLLDATVGPPRSASFQVWQVKAGVGAWRTITTVP